MAAKHKERIERLDRIVKLLPKTGQTESCPDSGVLLQRLGTDYADRATVEARRRAIQRDLEELVEAGRIEIANPGGKPLRFRRANEAPAADPYLWNYARKLTQTLIRDALPTRRFEGLWQHVLDDEQGLGLGPDKLRVITDTQRLLPADISGAVLAAVLEGLAAGRTLIAGYRDADGKLTRPVLHPQGLIQRGPRVYLFALKDDEADPVRMYALHRMTRCEVGDLPARAAAGFSLESAVARGQADFGDGREINLVLRARGYVADLLRDCPLAEGQRMEDEAEVSDFKTRVQAVVPATGQLLRWILGCGANLEVLEPEDLRRVVASQVAKVASIYDVKPGKP